MQTLDFDSAAFLRDYWQKRPVLIRNPWSSGGSSWANPLEPDELAGLACEPEVESRLIEQSGKGWHMENGPFAETRFTALGRNPWTLLVQAVDHHVPDVAALIQPFRFVPDWRIDDVMVSYASDGGGVGPHFDQYDVFLVQGLGRRRWRVGARCDESTELLPDVGLRLLARFDPTDEWVLEPGDILYVPPGFAHDGVAIGDDCMTYSIGFRAPARHELISDWSDVLAETISDDDRYGDPDLQPQANPGEITAEALARLHAMIAEKVLDRDAFARWFGEYNTAPKYPETDWRPDEPVSAEEVADALADGVPLARNPASRFAFIRRAGGGLTLFVDGHGFSCGEDAQAFAENLCASGAAETIRPPDPSPAVLALIAALIDQGSLAFCDEDD